MKLFSNNSSLVKILHDTRIINITNEKITLNGGVLPIALHIHKIKKVHGKTPDVYFQNTHGFGLLFFFHSRNLVSMTALILP